MYPNDLYFKNARYNGFICKCVVNIEVYYYTPFENIPMGLTNCRSDMLNDEPIQ